MVQSITEGNHMEEFLFSEGNGNISREKAKVKSGRVLAAGTPVQLDGTKLVAATGLTNTAGAIITPVVGILSADVDATSADSADVAYIARDAEVVLEKLVLPGSTTPKNAVIKSLKDTLNIITR